MRTIFIVAFFVMTFVPSLWAQDDPKTCAAIPNDAKRLECFDLIFKKSSVTKMSENSQWRVEEEKSKIDDSTNVTLLLEATEPIRNQYGQPARLTILIVCREKTTNFYIVFGGHFMSSTSDYGTVTFRLDKKPAIQKQLRESTDHKALGLWGGAASVPFIKTLFGSSTLFVRATPFNESSITGEFNISGLQDAIAPLRQACGWKN